VRCRAEALIPWQDATVRRVFTIASALSLLLSVATVVLWVRSYRFIDRLGWDQERVAAGSEGGELGVAVYWNGARPHFIGWTSVAGDGKSSARSISDSCFMGFGFFRQKVFSGVFVPHWFIAVAFLTLPLALRLSRSRSSTRAGVCPTYGYDLRATPDRCPECGRPKGGHKPFQKRLMTPF